MHQKSGFSAAWERVFSGLLILLLCGRIEKIVFHHLTQRNQHGPYSQLAQTVSLPLKMRLEDDGFSRTAQTAVNESGRLAFHRVRTGVSGKGYAVVGLQFLTGMISHHRRARGAYDTELFDQRRAYIGKKRFERSLVRDQSAAQNSGGARNAADGRAEQTGGEAFAGTYRLRKGAGTFYERSGRVEQIVIRNQAVVLQRLDRQLIDFFVRFFGQTAVILNSFFLTLCCIHIKLSFFPFHL